MPKRVQSGRRLPLESRSVASGNLDNAPPLVSPAGRSDIEQMWCGKQWIAPLFRKHPVVDRGWSTSQRENAPQRASVVFCAPWAIPLIDSSIDVVFVVSQPQFGYEARETHKQRSVEQTFPAKELVFPCAPHQSQAELHKKDAGILRRPVNHRLAKDARRCAIRKLHTHPDMLFREMDTPLCQEPRSTDQAARLCPRCNVVRQRNLFVHNARLLVYRLGRYDSVVARQHRPAVVALGCRR